MTTTGCTAEACNFRDARADIENLAAVVGISKDSVASHKKFSEKYHLNFTYLLSDPNHEVIAAYDSWTPKKFMGKEYLGTNRNTFIITPDGKIAKEYIGVDPKEHAEQIIADLEVLQSLTVAPFYVPSCLWLKGSPQTRRSYKTSHRETCF